MSNSSNSSKSKVTAVMTGKGRKKTKEEEDEAYVEELSVHYDGQPIHITSTTQADELGWFVRAKMRQYEKGMDMDTTLANLLADDFDNWSDETFKRLTNTIREEFRRFLLRRGIWVERPRRSGPVNERISQYKALAMAVRGESTKERWSDADIQKALVDCGRIESRALCHRLNNDRDTLLYPEGLGEELEEEESTFTRDLNMATRGPFQPNISGFQHSDPVLGQDKTLQPQPSHPRAPGPGVAGPSNYAEQDNQTDAYSPRTRKAIESALEQDNQETRQPKIGYDYYDKEIPT